MKTRRLHYFFRITGRIDDRLRKRFERFCEKIPKDDPCPVLFLLFNSKGGDLGEASKIVEIIQTLRARVVAVSYGSVHSAAIPIFATGNLRLSKNDTCTFLFHKAKKLNDRVTEEEVRKSESSVLSFVAQQINAPVDKLKELTEKETYLSSPSALSLGLIHKIL